MSSPKLFQPIQVGDVQLQHRVVMAPLTRFRANKEGVINDIAQIYYGQRASTPGTLLISEATFIAAQTAGYEHVPALEKPEQLEAWKKVTDAVHAKKSFIFAQLWAHGRAADPEVLKKHGFPYVAPSDIPLLERAGAPPIKPEDAVKPRPMTIEEIKEYVQLYATAAANAVNIAGFDGVELHGANGYLIDQFLQDVSNTRTDEYGGSIENRARFALEVIDAVVKAVGAKKIAIRLSPWGKIQDMGMADPVPTFSYLVKQIAEKYPDFAYIHVVEPRVNGIFDRDEVAEHESNDFLRDIWAPRPFISAGGYNRQLALDVAEKKGDLIAFGRLFIANPDLPLRLKLNIPVTPYNRGLFYQVESPEGYIDYPFAEETELAGRL
ncbi:NADH:flavin oxidoreductase/NADH oxidase [Panus rudis PR-1116 ss-1]|nr:NADH:flavin oxidoreductase/NADH oxidase [Panus rudis PR-1116 ss-1]